MKLKKVLIWQTFMLHGRHILKELINSAISNSEP
jgi:hypothetical protein